MVTLSFRGNRIAQYLALSTGELSNFFSAFGIVTHDESTNKNNREHLITGIEVNKL